MQKIFDTHTHIYPDKIAGKACVNLGQFYDFVVEGKGTYDDLEADSKPYGTEGFLLFSVATNPTQVEKVNDYIAKMTEYSRSRGYKTIGYAGMHQDFPDFAAEIARIKSIGLQGVKIHPDIQGVNIDDEKLFPLYEIIEGDIPLYLHMGDCRPQYRFSEPRRLKAIKKIFPKLTVIAAHLGGYSAWDEAVRDLADLDGIMYDTSSTLWAISPKKASDIIHALGTERVMFGTDYPVVKYEDEMQRFDMLNLTDTERADILWNNAEYFYKL